MISVAMATYNGEKYIKRQLESVILNLSEEDEVVISDDGSTDETIKIVESYHDARIKIIEGPRKGLVKNFENAIKECRGDYIFLCDQDDYWYPHKVSNVLKCFEETDSLLIEHDGRVVNKLDEIIYPSFFGYRKVRRGLLKNMLRNTYHGCLMAFRSTLKPLVLPLPDKGCLHDQWIGIIADYYGKVYFLNEILMDYVRHDGNCSSFEHLSVARQFTNRISLIINLFRTLVNLKYKLKQIQTKTENKL